MAVESCLFLSDVDTSENVAEKSRHSNSSSSLICFLSQSYVPSDVSCICRDSFFSVDQRTGVGRVDTCVVLLVVTGPRCCATASPVPCPIGVTPLGALSVQVQRKTEGGNSQLHRERHKDLWRAAWSKKRSNAAGTNRITWSQRQAAEERIHFGETSILHMDNNEETYKVVAVGSKNGEEPVEEVHMPNNTMARHKYCNIWQSESSSSLTRCLSGGAMK